MENFTRSGAGLQAWVAVSLPAGHLQNGVVAETLDRRAVCVSTTAKSRVGCAPGRIVAILVESVEATKIGEDLKAEPPSRSHGGPRFFSGSVPMWIWAK